MSLHWASAAILYLCITPLCGQTDRVRAREAFERGMKDEMEGRLDAAVAAYSEAIQADSSFFAARRARGVLRLREKRYVEAVADFEAALRLIEGDIDLARLLNEARTAASKPPDPPSPPPPPEPAPPPPPQPAPLADPKAAEMRHRAGRAAIQAGKLQEALAELTEAVELDPRHALAWNARGYVHLLLKQPEKALEDFNRAIENNPDYLNALVNRSEARRRLGDKKGAAGDAARAQAIASKR